MHVVARRAAAAAGSLVLLGAGGCDVQLGTLPAAGPRKQICGQEVGGAESRGIPGPFYLDGRDSDVSFHAMAYSSGTWVRVSADCDRGSVVTVPVSASVALCSRLRAGPGADLAVLITPMAPGTATVDVAHRDGSVTHIDVTVTTAIHVEVSPPSGC